MKVLLSIKPEFANKIFSGEKGFEYRKVLFKRPNVTHVIIYATKPIGKIVGEFKIEDVIEGAPGEVWENTRKSAGISKAFFMEYFSGKNMAYAIKIGSTIRYPGDINPKKYINNFFPPQSFSYLDKWPPSELTRISDCPE